MPKELGQVPTAAEDLEEQLTFIASHIPVAVAHVVQDGNERFYRFVNQRYAELYGRNASEVIGQHPRTVLGEQVYAQASVNMDKCLAGEAVEFDLDLKSSTGIRRLLVKYIPDRDKLGHIRGFLGVISDVTELRALQQKV